MSLNLEKLVKEFLDKSEWNEDFELYNEAGLQHELAFFLREKIKGSQYCLQLERNINGLRRPLSGKNFVKREMDIYIYQKDGKERYCIELKFPNKGAFPRRMYQTFEDIKFIEQLKLQGNFEKVAMLFMTSLKGFRTSSKKDGIYRYFREDHQISELDENEVPDFIRKDAKFEPLEIYGSYPFQWKTFRNLYHYFVIVF